MSAQSPSARAHRVGERHRRVAALDLGRPAPGLGQGAADHRGAAGARAPPPGRRPGPCRRRSRRARARSRRPRTGRPGPRAGPARPRAAGRGAAGVGPPGRRAGWAEATGTPGPGRPPRPRSASRCSGTGGPAAPCAPRPRRPARGPWPGPSAPRPAPPGASRCPGCRTRTGWPRRRRRPRPTRRRTSGSRPSVVVTARPATRRTGVTHDTRGAPSIHTVQQPHWPWGLQPSLGARQPSCSRRASSRLAPSSATATVGAVEDEGDRPGRRPGAAGARRRRPGGIS